MAKCQCGQPTELMASHCADCLRDYQELISASASAKATVATAVPGAASVEIDGGASQLFGIAGTVLLLIGLWLLFVAPGEGVTFGDRQVVNIHRVMLGTSAAVSGVVCLAAASILGTLVRLTKVTGKTGS